MVLTALVACLVAQTLPPVTVLKAASLFDGRTGKLSSPGLIVVEGQRITAVGPKAAVPAGANVIDLGDATLLPGFIDAHTHLTYDYDENWAQAFHDDLFRFPAEQALHAARNAEVTLAAGFTTVRNLGSEDFVDIGLRNAINSGHARGPRVLPSGYALGAIGGHCDAPSIPPDRMPPSGPIKGTCTGADQCRAAVRYQMKWGAEVIKICASGGVLSESDPVDVPQLTLAELSAIVAEAHAWGRKVAAHSHGDAAAKLAIEAGVDSIEHGSFLTAATLQLMKQKGVYLVPTRTALNFLRTRLSKFPEKIASKARAAEVAHTAMMKNAVRLGVPLALGTDAPVYPHGLNAREFGDLVDLGLDPAAALLTSSLGAATLLGVEKDTGTLEVGKLADVVAVPGNVLAHIRATETPVFVMKQGEVVRR